MQYLITSAPAQSFGHVRRAGRNWPKNGTLVEVIDDAKDPQTQPNGGPMIIGQETWKQLKDDVRIFARPAGDIEDIAAQSVALVEARERIAVLEAENAALRAQIGGSPVIGTPTYTGETQPTAPASPSAVTEHESHRGKGKKG
jgi:hypothetical protein